MVGVLSIFAGYVSNSFAEEGHGGHSLHWRYEGNEGPNKWGSIDSSFSACSNGHSQSPIDIVNNDKIIDVDAGGIKFEYNATPLSIVNNGHTIQVNYSTDSSIKMGSKTYKLLQFHFHSPSENKVDGNNYKMEAHLVHKNADGNLAVVGVFIKEGKENPFIKTLWDNLPTEINKENLVKNISVNANDLLPADGSYYHFSGSLTTPPCSEEVN